VAGQAWDMNGVAQAVEVLRQATDFGRRCEVAVTQHDADAVVCAVQHERATDGFVLEVW
jgi:hypothetical protein